MLSFLQATRRNLGNTAIDLLRADAGFFADEILKTLEAHGADDMVATKSAATLQAQLMKACGWWAGWSRAWSCVSLTIRQALGPRLGAWWRYGKVPSSVMQPPARRCLCSRTILK